MSKTLLLLESSFLQLRSRIEYPSAGILSKIILQLPKCQYTLFCLAEGTELSEHTSTKNATVNVLDGKGILTLEGKDIPLETSLSLARECSPRVKSYGKFSIFAHSF
jgi:hypothetical protein